MDITDQDRLDFLSNHAFIFCPTDKEPFAAMHLWARGDESIDLRQAFRELIDGMMERKAVGLIYKLTPSAESKPPVGYWCRSL